MLARIHDGSRTRTALGALAVVMAVAVSERRILAQSSQVVESHSAMTADFRFPPDQLRLLVKPLTKEELEIEAAAWRDLLKAKVSEISQAEIEVRTASLPSTRGDATAGRDDPQSSAGQPRVAITPEDITVLRGQRVALTDRLNVVLDELEAKGGDVEQYRRYVRATSGLNVDVSDAGATWTAVKGWLFSAEGGIRWGWNIAKFLLMLFAFRILAGFLGRATEHAANRWQQSSALLKAFLAKVVRQGTMLVGLVVALSALEVNVGPILALIGAAGFVIGLALQNTLSNFASGLLILAYRPFDVGDVIEAGGVSGSVESMNLLSTHVKTFDNKHVIVPNNDIWGGVITNATASATRRVDMTFGIGYEDDIATARQILERIVTQHELVLDDPAPTIQLNELADSSVNFICRPWVRTPDYWTVYWDVTRRVKEEFDTAGISIPFPQRDVHVYQHSGEAAV